MSQRKTEKGKPTDAQTLVGRINLASGTPASTEALHIAETALLKSYDLALALVDTTVPTPAWRKSPIGESPHKNLRKLGRFIEQPNLSRHPGQAKAIETLRDDPRRSLYLYGTAGVGKTHLLAHQFCLNNQADDDECVHTWFMSDKVWLDELQRQQVHDGLLALSGEVVMRDALDNEIFHHVYFGDFGTRRLTDWARDELGDLLDALYTYYGRLSIASQYSPQRLMEHIGDRAFRRIRDLCSSHGRIEVT